MTPIRWTRRLLSLLWGVALTALLALAAWSHVTDLVIIQGTSMEPAVPLGSLLQPRPISAARIERGDVITVRADNGVLITHRVLRVVDLPGGRFLELKGDANVSPDPMLVPAGSVVGRAEFVIPLLGFVLAMLATPLGFASIVALLGAGLIGCWLLEDAEAAAASQRRPMTLRREVPRSAPNR